MPSNQLSISTRPNVLKTIGFVNESLNKRCEDSKDNATIECYYKYHRLVLLTQLQLGMIVKSLSVCLK